MTYRLGKRAFAALRVGMVFLAGGTAMNTAQAGQITLPEMCEPLATVLKTHCTATTLAACGEGFVAASYKKGAFADWHEFDANWSFQAFETNLMDDARFEIVPGSGAAMSFADLAQNGSSAAGGAFVMKTGRLERGFDLSGETTLDGGTISLGGETFRTGVSHRNFKADNGAGGMVFDIDIFVSEGRNLFLEGDITRSVFGSDPERLEGNPLDIAWPGQPGFLTDGADMDCEG